MLTLLIDVISGQMEGRQSRTYKEDRIFTLSLQPSSAIKRGNISPQPRPGEDL